MDRMSPQDASFLHVENDVNHMHIASVGVFEGPSPSFSKIVEMVESKLHRVPRYRQKVRFVPLELGRPVWCDDPHFDVRYHVRHTALPSPGGDTQLRNLVGRVMSQQLDRSKPLWELWIVEGLEGGRWAMLSKTHHCMVDGVSATDLLTVILDDRPDAKYPKPDPWNAEIEPTPVELVTRSLGERLVLPREQIRGMRSLFRAPARMVSAARELASGLGTFQSFLRSQPQSSLNGPIGPHRRWGWAEATLDDVKRIRKAHGGTVNDVVLTAIARGFRDLLLARGEVIEDTVVRSLVPVSVRKPDEKGTYNNRVSAMFAELPVGVDEPLERLRVIRRQLDGLKENGQAVAAERLVSLSGFAPSMLLALGARVFARLDQNTVQTVTTNVPGPQEPLYAVGRKLLASHPYVPLAGSVRIGVAIFSYAGNLSFGVTGDAESAPDIDVLCSGIEKGIEELLVTS